MKFNIMELLKRIKFEYVFQLIVLLTLVVYIFISGDVDNVKLIIGAFIGVLSNTKFNSITVKNNDKKEQLK